MGFHNGTDWSSQDKGPNCPKCHNNEQMFRYKENARGKFKGGIIPLPYKHKFDGWLCHHCSHYMPLNG